MVSWQYVQTPHFDIYYYEGMDDIARIATTIAEEAYSQISSSFDYRLRNRVPVVLYRSQNQFSQTHLTPQLISEGIGGFTEFLKNRVAVPFTGSYPQFRHTLHHELVHAMMHDMLYGRDILTGVQQSDVPLWFIEGLAEYESSPWNSESDMWMRDAVINDYLQLDGYFAYKGGQSIIYYIAEVYGPDKVAQILNRLRSFSRFGPTVQAVLGIELEDFGKKWQKDLKKVYWPEIVDRDEPEDVGQSLTDHAKDNSYFNRSPAFSPFGDKIAYLTGRDYYTSIYVMSAIDGKVLWKVVTGEASGAFEEMHWQRASIAWSPDAQRIAFAAKATSGDRLYIVDARNGKNQKTYDFEFDGMYSPDWSPDGSTIVFVGVRNGKSDLYTVRLADGTIDRLTNDYFDESDPKWSPDGQRILFASDRAPAISDNSAQLLYQTSDIYVFDMAGRRMRRLTDNPFDDLSPVWGPDGRHIAFVSDRNGIFNLYIAQMDDSSGTLESTARPLTNILTGAFSPSWNRGGEKIAFSAFNKGGWDVYVVRNPLDKLRSEPLRPAFFLREGKIAYSSRHRHIGTDSLAATSPDSTLGFSIGPRMRPFNSATRNLLSQTLADSARGGFAPKPYRSRLQVDNVSGQANYSTLGGVGGQLYVTASDLMGYHQLQFMTSLYRDLRDSDYGVFYQYLRRRTDYAAYFLQQRTWYPFQSYFESGLVERREVSVGTFASRPTSQFRRFEFGVDYLRTEQNVLYDSPNMGGTATGSQHSTMEAVLTRAAFVHDNALWNMFGPVLGQRWRITLSGAPPRANTAPFGVVTTDVRNYWRVSKSTSLALRASAGHSFATDKPNAPLFYVGGLPYWINYDYSDVQSSQLVNDGFSQFVFPLRGTNYYELRGRTYGIINAEYRFPLIHFLAAGPFDFVVDNVGGVMFLDVARTWDDPTQTSATRHSQGPLGAYGYGVRLNLGVMVLRMDVAWRTDLRETMGAARYYWSFGYDF
jgi:WD40 repeat protein